MKQLFIPEELIEPGWLQRMFSIMPKENARIELNNLLASKPIREITPEDIAAISTKYKIDLYKKFKHHLDCMYACVLTEAIKDREISDEELSELVHLKGLLNMNDWDVEDLHNTMAGGVFKEYAEKLMADHRLNDEEKEKLEALKQSLKLSDTHAAKVLSDAKKMLVDNYLRDSVSDERFSEEEEKEFHALCKSLGVAVDFDHYTHELLDKFKLYWLIENGEIPEQPVTLNLQKNEKCYFATQAEWLETRTVTKSIRYGGPAISFRIMRGVYYRMGQYNVERITAEETRVVDSGTFYITNKRFIFTGDKKNSSTKLEKVLALTPYSDGIEIAKDSGKNLMFRVSQKADLLGMIAGRALNDC